MDRAPAVDVDHPTPIVVRHLRDRTADVPALLGTTSTWRAGGLVLPRGGILRADVCTHAVHIRPLGTRYRPACRVLARLTTAGGLGAGNPAPIPLAPPVDRARETSVHSAIFRVTRVDCAGRRGRRHSVLRRGVHNRLCVAAPEYVDPQVRLSCKVVSTIRYCGAMTTDGRTGDHLQPSAASSK